MEPPRAGTSTQAHPASGQPSSNIEFRFLLGFTAKSWGSSKTPTSRWGLSCASWLLSGPAPDRCQAHIISRSSHGFCTSVIVSEHQPSESALSESPPCSWWSPARHKSHDGLLKIVFRPAVASFVVKSSAPPICMALASGYQSMQLNVSLLKQHF